MRRSPDLSFFNTLDKRCSHGSVSRRELVHLKKWRLIAAMSSSDVAQRRGYNVTLNRISS